MLRTDITEEDMIERDISTLLATMIVVAIVLRERNIDKYSLLLGSLPYMERTGGLHLSAPIWRFLPPQHDRVDRLT